jgi:cytochrome c-type biogenesis protein CcmH
MKADFCLTDTRSPVDSNEAAVAPPVKVILMILWPIFALMTVGAVVAVWLPLARRQRSVRSGSDIAVYRDQLAEIDRDEAASLIGKVEAEAAKVEVSRRLIAAAEAAEAATLVAAPIPGSLCRRATLAAVVVLLPLGAGAIYFSLGSPNLIPVSMNAATDGQPLPGGIEKTVAEVETHLESNPRNGKGWELLAPVYLRLGRFDDAVRARRNALEIFGPDAARLGDLGEAMVMASNGVVTAEAKNLFERANAADPEDVMAQYYLGLSAKQEGRRDEAEKRWTVMVSGAREGAEWLPLVKNALARIDEKSPSIVVAPPEHNGGAMEAMVERLAERLKKDGSDVAGWIQLVHSYRVLGKADKVRAAIADAHSALANNQEALLRLDQGLAALEAEAIPNNSASAPVAPATSAASVAPRGPSASDVAAAAQMAPAERNSMIEGMVARLAQRMAENGSDVDGWLRLIKAYSVLGERNKALIAAANARSALADNSDNLRRIGELTKELGLEGS